jgi:hypothetical protein
MPPSPIGQTYAGVASGNAPVENIWDVADDHGQQQETVQDDAKEQS